MQGRDAAQAGGAAQGLLAIGSNAVSAMTQDRKGLRWPACSILETQYGCVLSVRGDAAADGARAGQMGCLSCPLQAVIASQYLTKPK